MDKKRKKVDIKEEYYRLQNLGVGSDTQEWDQVRVPRPKGMPEWGAPQIRSEDLVPAIGTGGREGDRIV